MQTVDKQDSLSEDHQELIRRAVRVLGARAPLTESRPRFRDNPILPRLDGKTLVDMLHEDRESRG